MYRIILWYLTCVEPNPTYSQERLLAEQEASAGATESKLKAAAAELRAAEARAEGLQRELSAAEDRLEKSAQKLASNHQVIKWLNKELNDAQMVPGGTTSTAADVMAAAGAAYGGTTSPLRENIRSFNYRDIDIGGDQGFNDREAEDDKCAGVRKDTTAFTAGLRESLVGGVSWDLRGATMSDQNKTFTHGVELPRDPSSQEGEKTPDYAGRRRSSGDARSAGRYRNVVTPESADDSKSDLGLLHSERGVGLEMDDYDVGVVSEAGATRGIRAY